jgi:hypothetical protein
MSSARAYLFGHPRAWELPGQPPRRGVASRASLRSRLASLRAAVRRPLADGGAIAVEPGACA